MPLRKKGKLVLASFKRRYGAKKGTSVFYARLNVVPKMKAKLEKKSRQ